ncbi:hypothetical protein [Indioceanicola profundi]|uniref:hypothetical protein n=1 Tax=Indioceanicola profundi TaxID=2220096 RepID=UPI0013C47471|nr:hypothetical protein [Indioceanicola profundi]
MRTRMVIVEMIWSLAVLAATVATAMPAFAEETAPEQVAELVRAEPPAAAPGTAPEGTVEEFARQLEEASNSLRGQIELVRMPLPADRPAEQRPGL